MITTTCACGCGKTMPAQTSGGKARHFWRGHGDSFKRQAECGQCGKTFLAHQWRIGQFPKVFCSRACGSADRVRTETRPCVICGSAVTRRPIRFTGRVFCSEACKSQGQRNTARKANVSCSQCGTELLVFPSKLRQRHFYCNVECRSLHIVGATNPAYTTGGGRNADYGPNWKKQRRRALRRDKDCCRLCGFRRTGPRQVNVHHVRPIATFAGDFEAGNHISNLVSLCNSCHPKAEKNPAILDGVLATLA